MEMLQVVRADGEYDSKLEPNLRDEDLRKMYRYMLLVRRFNERMLLLQRQGRIGFFIESTGEEAVPDRERIRAQQERLGLPVVQGPGHLSRPGGPAQGARRPAHGQRRRPQQGQADGRPLGLQGVEHGEPLEPRRVPHVAGRRNGLRCEVQEGQHSVPDQLRRRSHLPGGVPLGDELRGRLQGPRRVPLREQPVRDIPAGEAPDGEPRT